MHRARLVLWGVTGRGGRGGCATLMHRAGSVLLGCVGGGVEGGCLLMNNMDAWGKVGTGSDLERGGVLCHTDAQDKVGDVAVTVG